MSFSRTLLSGLPALVAWLPAAAQLAPPPAPAYDSAFTGYRPFAAQEVQDWKRSNDTVREIGGWRAYAREIQGAPATPAPPGSPPPGPAQPPRPGAADPHQGHRP